MMRLPFTVALLLAACALAPFVSAGDKAPEKPPVYFRYDEDGAKGGSGNMELLVRRFHNPETGAEVTLAGMSHFADAAFYRRINAIAAKNDVVLLEGVKGGMTFTSIPLLYQVSLAGRLIGPARLEFQSDLLDGSGPRFRNADMDIKDMDTGAGAPADFVTLPLVVATGEAAYTLSGLAELGFAITGNGDAYTRGARSIMAESLTHEDNPFEGDERTTRVILGDRNAGVLKVLDEELAGRTARKILIPWGAAHHVGLEAGLRARGFVPAGDEWLEAIAVKNLNTSKETDPGFRWQIPYALNLRFSDTTSSVTGPLALATWHESPHIRSDSTLWGLLHSRMDNDLNASASVLAGLLWTNEEDKTAYRESTYALAGLWGREHTPARDAVRFGWWGFLGGASDEKDEAGAPKSSSWHLPFTFGKFPLIYGEKTDAASGETEHRFLLFFKTTSGK